MHKQCKGLFWYLQDAKVYMCGPLTVCSPEALWRITVLYINFLLIRATSLCQGVITDADVNNRYLNNSMRIIDSSNFGSCDVINTAVASEQQFLHQFIPLYSDWWLGRFQESWFNKRLQEGIVCCTPLSLFIQCLLLQILSWVTKMMLLLFIQK